MIPYVKDFFRKLSLNKIIITLIASLSILFILLDIGNSSNLILKNDSRMSLADCFVSSAHAFVFSLCYVPLLLLLLQNIIKDNFIINIVLKSKRRTDLWNKMWIQMLLTSVFVIILLLIFTCLIGSFYSTTLINWATRSSYYFNINQVLNPNIGFHQVVIRFLVISILRCLVTGSIFQLVLWIWDKAILSWAIILIFNCFSVVFTDQSFLYGGNVTLRYSSWLGSYHYVSLFPVVLFLIVIYLFGYIMSNRKEFLNAKS